MIVCPECDHELEFIPEIIGDNELNTGVYVCTTVECENYDKEVYNSGDFM